MKQHKKNLLISLISGLVFLGVCFASPNEENVLTFLLWVLLAVVSMSIFATFGLVGVSQWSDHKDSESRKGQSLVTSHYCGGHH